MAGIALALVGVLAAWLLRGGDDGRDRDTTVAAVCRVASIAEAGDADEARRVFTNEAHEPIHELARQAGEVGERAAAARLLEAKEVIESAEVGPSGDVANELVDATVAAATAVGRESTGCE